MDATTIATSCRASSRSLVTRSASAQLRAMIRSIQNWVSSASSSTMP